MCCGHDWFRNGEGDDGEHFQHVFLWLDQHFNVRDPVSPYVSPPKCTSAAWANSQQRDHDDPSRCLKTSREPNVECMKLCSFINTYVLILTGCVWMLEPKLLVLKLSGVAQNVSLVLLHRHVSEKSDWVWKVKKVEGNTGPGIAHLFFNQGSSLFRRLKKWEN